MFNWSGGNGKYTAKIKYNGAPARCVLEQCQTGWRFAVYDMHDKYIVKYKFRNVSLAEAQDKAEYYVNMEI